MKKEQKKTLHVLIVENNLVDSKMVAGMLSKSPQGSFEIKNAGTLKQAFNLIENNDFDVVLLDLNLNDSQGLETLSALHEECPDLPIVVHTGIFQDEVGLKAITIGAQDYLIKGNYLAYGLCKSLYYAIERKKAEKELTDAYNRLKDTQSQLIQAEKMNIVGAVTSGVAHEVKNPLATIFYGIEFLKTKLDGSDEKIDLTLKSIYEAAHKADSIVKDLLDFSTLSNIDMQYEDINTVIEHSLHLTNHQCEKFCVTLIKDFSSDLPRVKINRNRIEQVIVNLILNSINAMNEGGSLKIKTYVSIFNEKETGWTDRRNRKVRDGDKILVVDIDDTGHGIETDNLSKIFDPFFTTRRGAGGVGLGLSIARTIMTNHNGYIDIFNLGENGARARLIFGV